MKILFYASILLILYTYGVYPLLLRILSRCFPHKWRAEDRPVPVTVVISVFNEETVIAEKLVNTLKSQYPGEYLEVLVASDGSTDRTDEIVRGFADKRVTLHSIPGRKGKTACLNEVVPKARHDIVLFTDANSMFPEDALQKIVRNFADERVGLVTGWTRYVDDTGRLESTGIYSSMERDTKYFESAISSCVGADGAIFAVRRDLFKPLSERDINDFVIPLQVIAQGKRVVMDRDVYCIEKSASDRKKEFRRQARITNRTLDAIRRWRSVLAPWRNGWFSFFLFSHKLVRFVAPIAYLVALVSAPALATGSPLDKLVLVGLIALTTVGALGAANVLNGRLSDVCAAFLTTLLAQLVGWYRFLSGRSETTWTPIR